MRVDVDLLDRLRKKIDGKGSSIETMVRYGNIYSDQFLKLLEKWPHVGLFLLLIHIR